MCGAGTMGSGIAQVFFQNEFKVILFDVNEKMLDVAAKRIEKYAPGAMHQIKFTSAIEECVADVIIEAVVEDANVKAKLFDALFQINGRETIFVTNTSSLSVTKLAMHVADDERFAGLHFFNPAPLMKLVEVVKTPLTTDETISFLCQLVKQIGKTPVVCKDSPGFIVNRVARPYYLESLRLIEKNESDIEIIDQLMEASGFRMGPFKLMDLIGNDVNYAVSCIVYEAMNKPDRLKPSPIQEEKVKDGELGRKNGKGYYEYPST